MNIQRCLISFIVAATLIAAQPNHPDAALGAARHLEEAEGNYPAAIQAYKKILAQYGKNRPLAAKALVRMGQCYEKLGDAEARKTYERVMREFADQKEAMEEAQTHRSRLAATLGRAPSGMTIRRVWANLRQESPGQISRDGRYFNFTSGKGLQVLDLSTGASRTLVAGVRGSGHRNSVFSPDDKQIAFGFDNEHEIRTISVDGKDMRTIARTSGDEFIFPRDWSADGKRILAVKAKWTQSSGWDQASLVWLNASDGNTQVILTKPGTQAVFARVSPDGRYIVFGPPHISNGVREVHLVGSDGSGEVTLSAHQAGEFPAGWSPDGRHVLFISMRSGTAELWAVPVSDGKLQSEPFLIKRNLGDQVSPCGITRAGVLHYSVSFANGNMQQLEIWAIENLFPIGK